MSKKLSRIINLIIFFPAHISSLAQVTSLQLNESDNSKLFLLRSEIKAMPACFPSALLLKWLL